LPETFPERSRGLRRARLNQDRFRSNVELLASRQDVYPD
jgi:hypothetical protein